MDNYAYMMGNESPISREALRSEMVNVNMSGGGYSNRGLTTKGLNGCIALISRTANGSSIHGIMTHYPPLGFDFNMRKINDLIGLYRENFNQGKTNAVLLHPKMGPSVEELAMKVKDGFENILGNKGIIKVVPYPVEEEYVMFTGTEGILDFDVPTGRYDFEPFTAREGYNPDFHSFL